MTLRPMDVVGRIPRLRGALDSAGCDAFVVTNPTNVRYLTGFTGSAGMLLVDRARVLLVTDGRYETQAADQFGESGVEADIGIGNTARQLEILGAAASSVERLGLEAGHLSWAQQRNFAADVFPGVELVATEQLVETLRLVKDAGEIERMETAAGMADEALAAVRRRLLDRPSEREFALELDFTMRRLGADDVSFPTIVASGPNGAKPHAQPSDRRIEPGELVVVDFGALVDGYHSDMTRTLCVGAPATATARRMVDVVAESQAAGVAAVRSGAGAREVDAVCRGIIAAAGFGDAFVHGTGHGLGLEIHEPPVLSATATATLQCGFVITVEPGVYRPAEGGARIEDSVVVTAGGCRCLTNSPKELVID